MKPPAYTWPLSISTKNWWLDVTLLADQVTLLVSPRFHVSPPFGERTVMESWAVAATIVIELPYIAVPKGTTLAPGASKFHPAIPSRTEPDGAVGFTSATTVNTLEVLAGIETPLKKSQF